MPTLALTTTQSKSKVGYSNNHTNHCDGKGGKSPPLCTRIRATKDTSEEETIHTRADAVTKLYHPNQQDLRQIWNTPGCVHSWCIAWNSGQYRVNSISINNICKKYTHKILSNEQDPSTKNKTRETATTQTPGELPKYQIDKMGVSQLRFMADTNISTNKNDNRRIRFHGEPLSTNQRRQGPEPTIMENMEHGNISGNQVSSAGIEENDERPTETVGGVEESPQKRARTSSELLGAQQKGPVTFNGPSQGLLMHNACT